MSGRDDFTKATIEILARRVGNRCSNPDCRKLTSGPREDPTKAVNIGVAAHITAAAKGGPRYDPTLTSAQRKHPDNGLWLCWNCSKFIDNDPERYPVELLLAWKRQAEQAALDEIEGRALPPAAQESLEAFLADAVGSYEKRMWKLINQEPDEPYKFLYYFEIEDEDIFFGRDTASEDLYDKVLKERLTVLHARSGAGKTSLLNAGLSPRLIRRDRMPVYARAYQDPIDDIKEAIAPRSREPWPPALAQLSLREFLGQVCAKLSRETEELVLILDQFEEFFVTRRTADRRQPFIDALADCYDDRSLPLRIVIALRKDYYSDLAELQGRIPTIFYNEYRLDIMNRDEAREAIVKPVQRVGRRVEYEQPLLDTLLDDLARGGMELPHLQIICTRLYDTLPQGERTVTLASYEELGRAEGVLARYLQDVLNRFSDLRASIARQVLKDLVSSEATKRVLSYRALAERIKADGQELDPVLEKLVDSRLLRRSEAADEIVYEMAHEHLIREIETWMDQADRDFKQAEELLAGEVLNWQRYGTSIPRDRLEVIHRHREQFRGLDGTAWQCIVHSALQAGFAAMDWVQLLGEPGIAMVISALEDPSSEIRLNACRVLREIEDRKVVDPLCAALKDTESWVRQEAARALGRPGEEGLVEPLLVALQDQDEEVRSAAAEALGKIGDERALVPLIDALKDDVYAGGQAAIEGLVQFGRRAVDPLAAALQGEDERIRQQAVAALGRIGGAESDPRVCWQIAEHLAVALRDSDGYVRMAAVEALAQQRDDAASAPLLTALQDPNEDVRRTAINALVERWDPRAGELLPPLLQDSSSEVRSDAARLLGYVQELPPGSPERNRAVELLMGALDDPDEGVRSQAAETLGTLADPRATQRLIAALQDGVERVRRTAAEALGNLDDERVIEPLMEALHHRDESLRERAARALGQLASLHTGWTHRSRIVESLLPALQEKSPLVRSMAAYALGPYRDRRAVKPLIEVLGFRPAEARAGAAWSLGQIRDPEAVEPLRAALNDENEEVRGAAFDALREMTDALPVETLISALQDQAREVRCWAAVTLQEVDDSRAVEPLLTALEDESREVRQAAVTALGTLGDRRAVEPILPALQDRDDDLRRAAAQALGSLGDARAIKPLLAILRDEPVFVRQTVVEALRLLASSQDAAAVPDELSRMVEPLLGALQDEGVRWDAIQALGSLGAALTDTDERGWIVEALLTALREEGGEIHEYIATALGEVGDARAVEPLLATMGDSEDLSNWAKIQALQRIGAEAVDPLVQALEQGAAPVRRAAAEVLEGLRDAQAFQALLRALDDDAPEVRSMAARALGSSGDARAVEPLLEAVRDEDQGARASAVQALGLLGDARAFAPLTTALNDHDPAVGYAAALALGELGERHAGSDESEQIVPPLIAALRRKGNQQAVVASLARLGDPRAVDPLIAILRDTEGISWVLGQVAEALGRLGDPRAVKPLIAALTAPSEQAYLRMGAARALGILNDDRAVEPLITALQAETDGEIRIQIAESLGQLGDVRATESLIATLQDRAEGPRWEAARALGQIGAAHPGSEAHHLIVDVLLAELDGRDETAREAAATALGILGETRAVEPLLAALGDRSPTVRWAAVEALGQIGAAHPGSEEHGRIVQTLLAALEGRDKAMRRAAAAALGTLGEPRAVEPLLAALGDPSEAVRRAAAEALGQLADPDARPDECSRIVDALVDAVWDQADAVYEAAAGALETIGTPQALAVFEDQAPK